MDTPITRAEHEEFKKRLEEENRRQDRRIELLENQTREISALATSVEKLALSIDRMTKEQEQHSKRLEVLEGRDGELWRAVVKHAVTAAAGILAGLLAAQLGIA